ncbi:MAG: hypothetical protein IKP98_03505 [Bacilli bacterium]|nr:hypothetical protein [Bacilli bacterium]
MSIYYGESECKYYVFRTQDDDYEKFFREGILFFSLDFSMDKHFEKFDEEDAVLDYLDTIKKGETAYVVRIPKDYLKVRCYGEFGENRVLPYPFLYERYTTNEKKSRVDYYPILVPVLIESAYKDENLIFNPNYSQTFNPNGLKHTSEQLKNIASKSEALHSKYRKRNQEDCVKLYFSDKKENFWRILLEHYRVFGDDQPFPGTNELVEATFSSGDSKDKKKTKNNKKKKIITE